MCGRGGCGGFVLLVELLRWVAYGLGVFRMAGGFCVGED